MGLPVVRAYLCEPPVVRAYLWGLPVRAYLWGLPVRAYLWGLPVKAYLWGLPVRGYLPRNTVVRLNEKFNRGPRRFWIRNIYKKREQRILSI